MGKLSNYWADLYYYSRRWLRRCNPMRTVNCDARIFYACANFKLFGRKAKIEGNMSQEDVIFFGFSLASTQPNMIDEDFDAPPFYWCPAFVKWFV